MRVTCDDGQVREVAITPQGAASALDCRLRRWRSLIGIAIEEDEDGPRLVVTLSDGPRLVVTLSRVDRRARRSIPLEFCGHEVRLRSLAELEAVIASESEQHTTDLAEDRDA
jgi:hypothetical protein